MLSGVKKSVASVSALVLSIFPQTKKSTIMRRGINALTKGGRALMKKAK